MFHVVHNNVPNFVLSNTRLQRQSVKTSKEISVDVAIWCQRGCSSLFTAAGFKATLLFFEELKVSANQLSDQLSIACVRATACLIFSWWDKVNAQSWHPNNGLKVGYKYECTMLKWSKSRSDWNIYTSLFKSITISLVVFNLNLWCHRLVFKKSVFRLSLSEINKRFTGFCTDHVLI